MKSLVNNAEINACDERISIDEQVHAIEQVNEAEQGNKDIDLPFFTNPTRTQNGSIDCQSCVNMWSEWSMIGQSMVSLVKIILG